MVGGSDILDNAWWVVQTPLIMHGGWFRHLFALYSKRKVSYRNEGGYGQKSRLIGPRGKRARLYENMSEY